MESLEIWLRGVVEDYGYLGLFLISFSESIIQPIPPDPFIAGASFLGLDPLTCAVVATVGSVMGGLVAHTLGLKLGEPVIKRILGDRTYRKGEELFNRYGYLAVIISALTPIPFKAVCWLSGMFEMNRAVFLVSALVGRFPRFLMVAFIGDSINL